MEELDGPCLNRFKRVSMDYQHCGLNFQLF